MPPGCLLEIDSRLQLLPTSIIKEALVKYPRQKISFYMDSWQADNELCTRFIVSLRVRYIRELLSSSTNHNREILFLYFPKLNAILAIAAVLVYFHSIVRTAHFSTSAR